jgi:hypothetical protein
MATIYRDGQKREVPDFQVDYLIGKTPSSKGDYIPNPYSTTPPKAPDAPVAPPVTPPKLPSTGTDVNNDIYGQMQDFLTKQKSSYDSYNIQSEEEKARQAEADRLAQMRAVISKQAGQQKGIAKELGQKKEEGYRVGLGMTEGLNWSSLGTDQLTEIGRETQSELDKINQAEQQALASADLTSIDVLKQQLSEIRALKAQKEQTLIDVWKQITQAQDKPATGDIEEYSFYVEQERNAGREPISFLEWKIKGGSTVTTEKPFVVAPGSSIYDSTGNYIGTAPERPTDTSKPVTQEVEGTLLQWNPSTNGWEIIYTAPEKTTPNKIVKIDGVDYEQDESGNYVLPEVPEKVGNENELLRTNAQFELVDVALANAEKYYKAAGRSTWKEALARGLFGATDLTQLQTFSDTIKTSLLTMAGDPNIKKFFGPQMSEADVRMMMAGGTILDPDKQNPDTFLDELTRIKELMARIKQSIPNSGSGQNNSADVWSELN